MSVKTAQTSETTENSPHAALAAQVLPAEMATFQKPLIADFYDNSFYNSETIWQYKITPSIFYSEQITAGERYTFTFSFKSNIAFNFLDITLIDHSPEVNFFMVLAPPSRQCTKSKANTEYKGRVTFTAVKSATGAVPHANVLLLEINADNSVQPTLTFTKFEIIKGPIVETQEMTLTTREQEVFNLLLAGVIPKEIATNLNISYATVLDHQKNLYRKLDVHNINELLVKYSAGKNQTERKETPVQKTNGFKAVFKRWDTIADDLGSHVNFTPKVELIQDNYTETYAITGNTSYKALTYAGILGHPNPSTLEAMRRAKGFSFTCLGDGNTYEVKITTTEARLNAEYNFYGKEFETENGVISVFSYNIDELTPLYLDGKIVPFNRDSIEWFLIQTVSKGDFNLKFWDIRFF